MGKNKWILCSERLPEEHEEENNIYDPYTLAQVDTVIYNISDLVIVTVKDFENDKVFVSDDYTKDGKWSNYCDDYFNIIAWMPMPKPYQE